jgi:hypothetical protein
MATLKTNRIFQALVLLLLCLASAMAGFALRNDGTATPDVSFRSTLLQQSDEKVVERKEYGYEPFEFENLGVKKVKIAPAQKLSARNLAEIGGGRAEDWLEDLEFTLRNNWDKPIYYIDFDLTFPETGIGRPMMVYDMDIGVHPTVSEEAKRYGKPLNLKPGEAYIFKLSSKMMEMIKKFLSSGGFQLANLNKAVIRIDYILFDDGMKWEQGSMYKPISGEEPAPGKPGKYERIKK